VLAAMLLAMEESPDQPVGIAITTLLGAVMGLQAATARFIAVKDVTTVVVTSTLTGLAADSVLGSGAAKLNGGGSARRFAAVVLVLAGAAVGTALLRWHLSGALGLAGLVVLLATCVGAVHARRTGAQTIPPSRTARTA
jgi:uncharacterized membrane protein YoaK (UPF0700 family)